MIVNAHAQLSGQYFDLFHMVFENKAIKKKKIKLYTSTIIKLCSWVFKDGDCHALCQILIKQKKTKHFVFQHSKDGTESAYVSL